uniref:Uncharacterized protein n=1 Tax=Panagrolaimus sp. ES5 TaxID=591445 RepID=A0AC34FAF3_9BILA
MILIFVMTKGGIQRGEIIEGNALNSSYSYYQKSSFYHYTTEKSLTFFLGDPKSDVYDVFQGFITFEELHDDGCLLSNNKPSFKFTDETQMLYFRSSYFSGLQYYINVKNQKCFWTFTAPKGYKFKLADVKIIEGSTIIVTSNQTMEFIKNYSPYYYYDTQKISISYTTSKTPQKSDVFTAYLSIVPKTNEISNTSCKFTDSSKFSIWEKENEANNFEKVFCSIIISIKPNHQLIVNITKFASVAKTDVFGYYMDNEGLQFQALDNIETFALEPNKDGSIRKIKWEYYSDEIFGGLSFRIEFQQI